MLSRGVDELELKCIARLVVAGELHFIALAAGAWNSLGKEAKHGLHKLVTHAGTKAAASSAEIRFDALEVGPTDDDAVEP